MDGLKIKLASSLQFRVSLALTIVMLVAAIAIGGIGFYSALHDAHELQDDLLRDIASMVDTRQIALGQIDPLNPSELEDPETHFVIQIIDRNIDTNSSIAANEVTFPTNLKYGMQTIVVQHKEWRVFVRPLHTGERLAVGQRTEVRNEIAEHAGMHTLLPILTLIPLLIALVIAVLRWMLAPLTKLAQALNARKSDDMRALPEANLPDELRPFIVSINSMLDRLNAVLEQQRRFVADAAHELRSPLTALSLQTQNLAVHELPETARDQLHEFRRGLKRANELVEQLTSLARAQLTPPEQPKPIALQHIVRIVFEEVMALAEAKRIELGFEQTTELYVVANEINLVTVIRNLVDNAIRYTQAGGRVDVILFQDANWAVIEVQDNGPGIPPDQQTRVFDPFYRILGSGQSGSGLGLSIVKSITASLHGEVSLRSVKSDNNHGLIVQLKLPLYITNPLH